MVPPSTSHSGSRPRQKGLAEPLVTWAVILLVLGFYAWTAESSVSSFGLTGDRNDYYNLLADGFRDGHLSMKVAPLAPGAPKPVEAEGLGNLPYLLDATFFQGRYYLYFGPAPVLAAFLPYRLLTGNDLSDSLVAVLFAGGGYLLAVSVLRWTRRRFFPRVSRWLLPPLALLLGLGNVCAVMLRHPLFYEAAIAGAFFFQGLFLLALFRAFTAARPGPRAGWLAVASLAFGLAVASRVVYAFGAVTLGLALFWFWTRREEKRELLPRSFRRLAWAALGPVGACALALMAYNYLRFGHVQEFGLAHQFSNPTVFGLRFAAHNLKLYFLSPPEFSWYFPFTLPIDEGARPAGYVGAEQVHGQIWSLPWVVLAFGTGILLWSRRRPALRPLAMGHACVLLACGNNLLTILCLGGRTNRYQVDFLPGFLLLGVIGFFVLEQENFFATAWRRLGRSLLLLSIPLIALHNLFVSCQLHETFRNVSPDTYRAVATAMNEPTRWAAPWLYPRLGPIRCEVRFPAGHQGELEPLVVTGSAGYGDFLLVHYLGDGWVRFVSLHFGYEDIVSAPVQVGTERVHQLEIELGSLYPPLAHPFFAEISRGRATLARRTVRVVLDGRPMLTAQRDFYEASPTRIYVGKNPMAPVYTRGDFSGEITRVQHLGLAGLAAAEKREPAAGAVRLDLTFPATMAGRGPEPLLVTGERGAGDAVFVTYVDDRHVRFGWARWDLGSVLSAPVELDPVVAHRLEIGMGSLFPPADDPRLAPLSFFERDRLKGTARVKLDGREVFAAPGDFPEADSRSVDVGHNAIGLAGCGRVFGGTIERMARLPLPVPAEAAGPAVPMGPVRLRVVFPAGKSGHREPLLSTGSRGQGDLLAVSYLDGQRVQFSLDHWGSPLIATEPLNLGGGREHVVEIDLGSLYPEEGVGELSAFYVSRLADLRRRLRVTLDGREALAAAADFYPATAAQVAVGTNAIGASTADPVFSGRILEAARPGLGAARPAEKIEDHGPVRLEVVLPPDRQGQAEPLVVTGRTGAADAVIVTYVDAGHVKFTWDHWGRGGPSSAVISTDYREPHQLEVDLGSFYPDGSTALSRALTPAEIARRRRALRVVWDGREVLAAEDSFHPAAAGELKIGRNPVGLSSATERFTGTIEFFARPGVPAAANAP